VRARNPQLREALAAEYVLGTLQGAARRRMERSLKDDPGMRRLVAAWQERLAPLGETIEPVEPPAQVWRNIQARIQPGARRAGFWANLRFWRGASLVSTALAVALAVYLAILAPGPSAPQTRVVVLAGQQGAPAMTVSWQTRQKGPRRLRVRVVSHDEMKTGTAWELWMLPGGDRKPVSLGLVDTRPTQELVVPEPRAQAIDDAAGMAMSVEPAGGSPTGLPTGPVIYQGFSSWL